MNKYLTGILVTITFLASLLGVMITIVADHSYPPPSPGDAISERDISIDHSIITITNKDKRDFDMYSIDQYDGDSMLPLSNKHTNVVGIQPLYPSEIDVGDIIVFRDDDNKYIMHRVVSRIFSGNESYFKTQGDNNLSPDYKLVKMDNIAIKVVMVIY